MKTALMGAVLALGFVVAACSGERLEGREAPPVVVPEPPDGGPPAEPHWRYGQRYEAPPGACFELCAHDPEQVRIRVEGDEPPGEPCAFVAGGEAVDLWVSDVRGGPWSPYHWAISATRCAG